MFKKTLRLCALLTLLSASPLACGSSATSGTDSTSDAVVSDSVTDGLADLSDDVGTDNTAADLTADLAVDADTSGQVDASASTKPTFCYLEVTEQSANRNSWLQKQWNNDQGHYLRFQEDLDGDGKPDRILHLTYFAGGTSLKFYDDDSDGDGKLNIHQEYDESGRILSHSEDRDHNDTLEYGQTYSYDDQGRLIKVLYIEDQFNLLSNLDTMTVSWSTNQEGHIVETRSLDLASDNTEDRKEIRVWTSGSPRELIGWSKFAGGKPTFQYTVTIANGKWQKSETDNDGNGTIDSVSTFEYDPSNGTQLFTHADTDNDGIINYHYRFDASGRLIEERADTDDDGTIDTIRTLTRNANGDVLTDVTKDALGNLIREVRYSYETNGLLALIEEDSDGNGVFERKLVHSYVLKTESPCAPPP